MDAKISEGLFSQYLDKHKIFYRQDFPVAGKKNVDFKVGSTSVVLCEVKEVRDSKLDPEGEIDAYSHIRDDIRNLRKKFNKQKPSSPVVLVTINFSSNVFTAFTVAKAMLGDIGGSFLNGKLGEISYLPKGNAALTKNGNTSISGVLIFNPENGSHKYLPNPFSRYSLPKNYFPDIEEIQLSRGATEQDVLELSDIMFWPYYNSSR